MSDNQTKSTCLKWMTATDFDLSASVTQAINDNLRSYRIQGPAYPICSTIIELLTGPNALIERWPQEVRILLNQRDHESGTPFDSWARPRDLEKRVQALGVWSSMLAFITHCWDFSCRDLERTDYFSART